MSTAINYLTLTLACTIACAADALLFPGGQEFFWLWGLSAFGMIACTIHAIFSE